MSPVRCSNRIKYTQPNARVRLPSIQETTACMHARDPGRGFFVVALALIGPSNCSGRCCHAFCYSSFSSPGRKESQLRAEADTSRKPTEESLFIVNQFRVTIWGSKRVSRKLENLGFSSIRSDFKREKLDGRRQVVTRECMGRPFPSSQSACCNAQVNACAL